MQYLGIDYGLRHIGLALGDDETRLATPWKTIEQTSPRETLDALRKIIEREVIDVIVIGIPTFGSARTEQRQATEEFIRILTESISIPIKTADESFTSLEAQQRLGRGGDDHAVAAMLILQGYFDKLL